MSLDALFRQPQASVPVRGVHFDLKGLPPTYDRLISLLDLLAKLRYNAVLMEWEDTFPWTVDQRFRCETAYTPDEIRGFCAAAAERGIQVISLVQCLGHMETPLSVPGYEAMREVPHRSDVLNPLAPGAFELVRAMVDDVLALTGPQSHFHLGGDEAWSFATHPDTSAFAEQHGRGALYLHLVEPLLDHLLAAGCRPILWHDMMRDWEGEALDRLRTKADLCVWGYQGHPDEVDRHYATRVIQRFHDHQLTLWGGTAYKGADGHNSDLPVPANRALNALAWTELSSRFGFEGVFVTAWSRYSTHDVQCEPIDGALDCLAQAASILHDGAEPAGGIEACRAALADCGELARFQACYDALTRLTATRRRGWAALALLREVVVTASQDGRRRSSGAIVRRWQALRSAVDEANAAGEALAAALAGLVPPLWVDRYVSERLGGLREELAELTVRAEQLDPAGMAAG